MTGRVKCIRPEQLAGLIAEQNARDEACGMTPMPRGTLYEWAGHPSDPEWLAAVAAGNVCGMWVTDEQIEHMSHGYDALTVCLRPPGCEHMHVGYSRSRESQTLWGFQWMPDVAAPAPDREPEPTDPDCGGCKGQGSHRRWCEAAVGRGAALRGRLSQRAEDLADTVGSNNPDAANHLYAAAGLLREQAVALREEYAAQA